MEVRGVLEQWIDLGGREAARDEVAVVERQGQPWDGLYQHGGALRGVGERADVRLYGEDDVVRLRLLHPPRQFLGGAGRRVGLRLVIEEGSG